MKCSSYDVYELLLGGSRTAVVMASSYAVCEAHAAAHIGSLQTDCSSLFASGLRVYGLGFHLWQGLDQAPTSRPRWCVLNGVSMYLHVLMCSPLVVSVISV